MLSRLGARETVEARAQRLVRERDQYEGWSNAETWSVALILDNNRESYDDVRGIVRRGKAVAEPLHYIAGSIKDYVHELVEEIVTSGASDVQSELVAQLLDAALDRVNWHEIAEHEMAD